MKQVGFDRAVKRLLARVQDENQKAKADNVIRLLVSELLKTPGALDELERAIDNPTRPSANCVSIPRKLGTVGLKSRAPGDIWFVPHFCCAIWRWPGVKMLDLISSDVCQYPSLGVDITERICINPSHFHFVHIVEDFAELCIEALDNCPKCPEHTRY